MKKIRYSAFLLLAFTACMNMPADEASFKAYPNPYDPSKGVLTIEKLSGTAYTLGNQHDLIVYDYSLTETYRAQVTPNGSNQLVWAGIDEGGTRVAPGVYFLKVIVTTATGVENGNEMLKRL